MSFGESHGCLKWFTDNGLADQESHERGLERQLLMISDHERELYKFFSLKRSFLKVWNSQTLDYYAQQLASKRELPKSYKDVEDDPHQMGGDFLIQVDEAFRFKLVLDYKSKTPVDRPTSDQLLQSLAKAQASCN